MRAVVSWSLWRLPAVAIAWILTVDVGVIALAVAARGPVDRATINLSILLASLSVAFSLASFKWDAIRRVLMDGAQLNVQINLLAIWDFAAAVLLPLHLAAAVVVVGSVAELPIRRITGPSKPYRYVYSTACTLTAAMTAHFCVSLPIPELAGLALAAIAYIPAEVLMLSSAVVLCREFQAAKHLLRPATYLVEAQTIVIALILVGIQYFDVPLGWLSLPVALMLQRHVVLFRLRQGRDPNVRPMEAGPWMLIARVVVEACHAAAVLRVDTADPQAAALVAQLQAGCDAIGWCDGGLAILLADCPGPNADSLANRMRSALRYNGISAQVVVAAKPRDGAVLADLLTVGEAELIARRAAAREDERAALDPPPATEPPAGEPYWPDAAC
ncbi:MAG TPA: hypothetical protein VFU36_01680 [Jatrophihabitans sp.]|nr:hypothetical protein [Jatrophihabitans sp.]